MKKITYLILFILNVHVVFAQLSEDFEGSFPPAGWLVADDGAGTLISWTSDSDAFSGSTAAFISFDASEATEDWLISPQFTPTSSANRLTFYQKQEFSVDFGSTYSIRVSTTGTALGDFVNIVDTQAENTFSNSYVLHSVDLSAYNGMPIYIAFVLEQDDGDSWFIDKINLEDPATTAPSCAITPSPVDTATNVSLLGTQITLNWSAPASGFAPSSYELYFGTSSGALTLIAETPNTSLTISGLSYSTVYYWQIVPKNFAGSAVSCSEWSFTTESMPPPPANDDCSNATLITTSPYENTQNAFTATNNSGVITSCSPGMNDGVWYTFQSANSGNIAIDVTEVFSSFDVEVAIYSGSCGAFVCVDSSDSNLNGGDESINVAINASTQYWINVGHYSSSSDGAEGSFKISLTLSGGATLSLDESYDTNLNFSLYPNPVNNYLNIRGKDKIEAVSIHNLLGQQVLHQKPNKTLQQIDISTLPSGIYMVTIEALNRRSSYKIIKQ